MVSPGVATSCLAYWNAASDSVLQHGLLAAPEVPDGGGRLDRPTNQAPGRPVEPRDDGGEALGYPPSDAFAARSLRIDSPRKAIRWAACTMRSKSASPSDGSGIVPCQASTGSWLAMMVDRRM